MKKTQGPAVTKGTYFLFTLGLVVIGWIIAAANTGISYLAVGTVAVPISTGVVACLVHVLLVCFLHRAWWLGVLSVLPAVFVLVGSVQYAPEAALDRRGERHSVRVVADSAADGGNNHRFTVVGRSGELDETLNYDGSDPDWKIGDRLDVITDPEGVVPMEAAADVDPGGQLGTLAMGAAGWTALTLLAGRRGYVRLLAGRELADIS
ncbi:hypothetical protein RB200_33425 [Streptomyces sp. PmtG]